MSYKDTTSNTVNKDEDIELRHELVALKDSEGRYVVNSIGAGDPVVMRALIGFIQHKVIEAQKNLISDTLADLEIRGLEDTEKRLNYRLLELNDLQLNIQAQTNPKREE